MKSTPGGRFAHLDNLKVLLVVGVIAVHAAITYGIDGAWYLEDHDSMADLTIGALTIFAGVGFLFGLGAFFLIAGRLSGPSLDRRGSGRFVRDRLVRLGIPVLFYVVLIAPVMEYVKARSEGGNQSFLSFAWDQRFDPAPGPTWFLEALLVFSIAYALVQMVWRERGSNSCEPLRGRQVARVGLAIAVLSFLTHLVFPLGEEHFHIQFALFPQYAILFGLGCAAGRRGWLETLTPELRRGCGIVGLMAVLMLPVLLVAGGFTEGGSEQDLYAGGWHWQAAGTSLLEAGLAATLPLFLVGWFRDRWSHQGALLRRMAASAYGAFIIHPPVLVGLALALHHVTMPAELKFLFVAAGGVVGSFGVASLGSRMPAVRRLIGSTRRLPVGPRPEPLLAAQPIAR